MSFINGVNKKKTPFKGNVIALATNTENEVAKKEIPQERSIIVNGKAKKTREKRGNKKVEKLNKKSTKNKNLKARFKLRKTV